jgi:hypothetical protein
VVSPRPYHTSPYPTRPHQTGANAYVRIRSMLHKGPPRKDITGQTFGKLTALHYTHPITVHYGKGRYSRTFWQFRCSCGKLKIISMASVVHGKTKSCGCARSEAQRQRQDRNKIMSGKYVYKKGRMIKIKPVPSNDPATIGNDPMTTPLAVIVAKKPKKGKSPSLSNKPATVR